MAASSGKAEANKCSKPSLCLYQRVQRLGNCLGCLARAGQRRIHSSGSVCRSVCRGEARQPPTQQASPSVTAKPSLVALQGSWDHLSCSEPQRPAPDDTGAPGSRGCRPPAALREAAFSSHHSEGERSLPPGGARLPGGMRSQGASLQLEVRLLPEQMAQLAFSFTGFK